MGKKRQTNISKHIKTRHKKNLTNRKVTLAKVDPAIKNINKVISNDLQDKIKNQRVHVSNQIPVESISIESLRKLVGEDGEKKERMAKLSIDDKMYLEKMLKKWGQNYGRMAQDIKLNKMQWTAYQIQKKHEALKKMFPEE